MSKEKACRACHKLSEDVKECPVCKGTDLTTFWSGFVMLINPEKSEIAQKMGIKGVGKYALRLSR
ncbi:MAG: transcription elongation factor subunit Spt4 [Candidatus Diapherotrites archaeon]